MMTFIGIMQLVLATAMPVIITEIGGDHLYSWIFSSSMLASLLTIPISSKMADLYGKSSIYSVCPILQWAHSMAGLLQPWNI